MMVQNIRRIALETDVVIKKKFMSAGKSIVLNLCILQI